MPRLNLIALLALIPSFVMLPLTTMAHEGSHAHSQSPLDPNEKDWATRHMQSEHHIANFDARSFFTLHDYDSDGYWEESEIRRTYGFENEDSYTDDEHNRTKKGGKYTPEEEKEKVADKIMEMFDTDEDGVIEIDEWLDGIKAGKRLPDFGYGPGHHGDDEYEYEIHHFEKYHDENSPDSDFNHPEDLRHFERHDARQRDAQSQANLDQMPIIVANIPQKFLRP